MIDWGQAGVTAGIVAAGWIASWITTSARHGQRLDTVEGSVDKAHKRIDGHDEQFKKLATDFVPRVELAETLTAIRESQSRTEKWLEFLLFNRKPGLPSMAESSKS